MSQLFVWTFVITVMFHLTVYGLSQDEPKDFSEAPTDDLSTYIDLCWNTFWEEYQNNHFTRSLYMIIILSSMFQIDAYPKMNEFRVHMGHMPEFLEENHLLPPEISLEKFNDHMIDITKVYSSKFRAFKHEPQKYNKKVVQIPNELKSLFPEESHQTKPILYADVFRHFVYSYVGFCSDFCQAAKKRLNYDVPYQIDPYRRKAEFLITVIPRFKEVYDYVQTKGDGNIAIAFDYGIDGPVDGELVQAIQRVKDMAYHQRENLFTLFTFFAAALTYFYFSQDTPQEPIYPTISTEKVPTGTAPITSTKPGWLHLKTSLIQQALVIIILIGVGICLWSKWTFRRRKRRHHKHRSKKKRCRESI